MKEKLICGGAIVEIQCALGVPTGWSRILPMQQVAVPVPVWMLNQYGREELRTMDPKENCCYIVLTSCIHPYEEYTKTDKVEFPPSSELPPLYQSKAFALGDSVRSKLSDKSVAFTGKVMGYEGTSGIVCKSYKDSGNARMRYTYDKDDLELLQSEKVQKYKEETVEQLQQIKQQYDRQGSPACQNVSYGLKIAQEIIQTGHAGCIKVKSIPEAKQIEIVKNRLTKIKESQPGYGRGRGVQFALDKIESKTNTKYMTKIEALKEELKWEIQHSSCMLPIDTYYIDGLQLALNATYDL